MCTTSRRPDRSAARRPARSRTTRATAPPISPRQPGTRRVGRGKVARRAASQPSAGASTAMVAGSGKPSQRREVGHTPSSARPPGMLAALNARPLTWKRYIRKTARSIQRKVNVLLASNGPSPSTTHDPPGRMVRNARIPPKTTATTKMAAAKATCAYNMACHDGCTPAAETKPCATTSETQAFSTSHGGNPARILADPITRPPGEGPRASATSTPETYHMKRGSSAATPAPGCLVRLTRTLPAARVLQHPRLPNILLGLGTPSPSSRGDHRCPMRSLLEVTEWWDEPQQSAVAPVGVDRRVTTPRPRRVLWPLHRQSTERRRGAYGTQGAGPP